MRIQGLISFQGGTLKVNAALWKSFLSPTVLGKVHFLVKTLGLEWQLLVSSGVGSHVLSWRRVPPSWRMQSHLQAESPWQHRKQRLLTERLGVHTRTPPPIGDGMQADPGRTNCQGPWKWQWWSFVPWRGSIGALTGCQQVDGVSVETYVFYMHTRIPRCKYLWTHSQMHTQVMSSFINLICSTVMEKMSVVVFTSQCSLQTKIEFCQTLLLENQTVHTQKPRCCCIHVTQTHS